MDIKNLTLGENKAINLGAMDVVVDGTLYEDCKTKAVMVESESDLANLPDNYLPGSVAFTAGYADMWQLNSSGEWVRFAGDESEA